jgi:hypothetical protein
MRRRSCGVAPPTRTSELFVASELFAPYTQGKGMGEQPLTSITCIAEAALLFTDLLMTCWSYYKNNATLIELNQQHRLTNSRTVRHHKIVSCCTLSMVLCKHQHGGSTLQPAAQQAQQGTPTRFSFPFPIFV